MQVHINKIPYQVNGNEFNTIIHNEYNNLNIRAELGEMERVCSLLKELKSHTIDSVIAVSYTHLTLPTIYSV